MSAPLKAENDVLDEDGIEKSLKKRTRRSFIVTAAALFAGYGGWRWLNSRPLEDGIPGPLRKMLRLNERLSRRLINPGNSHESPPDTEVDAAGPRANGDIGLEIPVDAVNWQLRIVGSDIALGLDDLKTLPEISQTTHLNCIEGWTTTARWTGVRLSDFTDKYFPSGRSKPYVGLATPKDDYYVGLDSQSAFHEQTLLCYAINGKPLENVHGAPLRLIIPTKYGIKNIKRIGTIRFTNERPSDYWAQQGYDWYAGL